MTVNKLMRVLSDQEPDAEVFSFDPDTKRNQPVIGLMVDGEAVLVIAEKEGK